MSFHTLPSSADPDAGAFAGPWATLGGGAGPESEAELSEGIPALVPPEVLQAMVVAAEAYDRLAETGQTVHFAIDPDTHRPAVRLIDLDGRVTGILSGAQVLRVAGGEDLD